MPSAKTRTCRNVGAPRASARDLPARKLSSNVANDVETVRTVTASKETTERETAFSRRVAPSISPAVEHPTKGTLGKRARSSSRQEEASQASPSPSARRTLRSGGSSDMDSHVSRHPRSGIQRFCTTRTAISLPRSSQYGRADSGNKYKSNEHQKQGKNFSKTLFSPRNRRRTCWNTLVNILDSRTGIRHTALAPHN